MKKKLLLKLFIASSPVLAMILLYLLTDPFRVLYHYDNFYDNRKIDITLNKDYTTTETFLNNYKTIPYNSYIFGSSRSRYYQIDEWKKHLPGISAFHFDAFSESLFGIEKKMKFIHAKGMKIKNVLFIIDPNLLSMAENSTGHLLIKHPATTGESNFDFQLENFKAFIDVHFLYSYIKFMITHKVDEQMKRTGIIDNVIIDIDHITNEINYSKKEMKINNDSINYYKNINPLLYTRSDTQTYYNQVIFQKHKQLLYSIKQMLLADNTNYVFIISPLYDQRKINAEDLLFLQELFGKNQVFDYSGINKITADTHNYYENVHYRPRVATEIMNEVYTKMAIDSIK